MLRSKTHILLPVLCLLCSLTVAAKDKEPAEFARQSSPVFIENKGQITDQHGAQRKDIDFKLETPAVNIFIGKGHMHYQWSRPAFAEATAGDESPKVKSQIPNKQSLPNEVFPFRGDRGAGSRQDSSGIEIYRLDVTLIGANPNAQLITADAGIYYENYYLPHLGENGAIAKSYRKIIYKNIYPNIDWVIYTSSPPEAERQGGAKYDFIIHPGGNPNDIQVRYDGATSLQLDNGNLTATTPFGSITENAPYTYSAETKEQITSSFLLNGNILSFHLAPYSGTIVIDPQLHWATYYTGSPNGAASHSVKISCDNAGNIYWSSHTESQTNVATTGAYQSSKPGSSNAGFLVKFNSSGIRQWGTYYGGINNNSVYFFANACDVNNDIYVAGFGQGTGLTTTNAHQSVSNYGLTALLVKFNSNGQRLWATLYGYNNASSISDIVISPYNDVYVTGAATADSGIATNGTHKSVYTNTYATSTLLGGRCHSFIAKFAPNGTRIWGTYFGDTLRTFAETISCDDSGKVFISGITSDTRNIATPNSHQVNIASNQDAFIAKFDSSGQLVWGTYYGGSGSELLQGSTCDSVGNIYVCGRTASNSGIATSGSFQPSKTLNNTAFIAKLSGSGQRLWGTYYGGNDDVDMLGLTIDRKGFLLAAGGTSATNLATIGSHQWVLKGTDDALIGKFTQQGAFLWATYFGGNKAEHIQDIITDNSNYIYVAGITGSDSGLATSTAHQTTYYGGNTGTHFLAKLDNYLDTVAHITALSAKQFCSGDTLKIVFDITPLGFGSNNVFTAQLSNSSGSFTNSVNIGSKTTNTKDTIIAIIPANTSTGQGYRVRIMSSNPSGYSADSGIIIYAYPAIPQVITQDTAICIGDTLKLNALYAGTDVSYKWAGPNSFTSTAKDTIIANTTFAASGLYTITATRAVCSIKDTQTMIVKPYPVTPVAGSNSPICSGDTIKLNAATPTSGVNYSWSGPNSFTNTTQNPAIAASTVAMSGNYIVNASLAGCGRKDTVAVTVNQSPTPVTINSNTPVCSGDTLKLMSGSSSTGVSYTWSGPNSFTGSIKDTSIANSVAAQTGWYSILLQLNGCTFKDSLYALVKQTPAISSKSYNSPLCIGETLSLSTGSITGASYAWTGVNNFSSSLQNPTRSNMQFGDTGWYKVRATVNGCISPVDSIRVTANPLPFVVIFANKDSLCNGEPVLFSTLPNNAGANPVYTWKVNAQPVGSGSSYGSSSLNNGDIVSCEMTDNTKCSTPYTDPSNDIQMKVFPWLAPAVTITANPNVPLKPYEYVTFTANVTNGGNTPTFQWKRNGQNVQGATSAVWSANTLNDNDSISVEIISNYKCPQPAFAKSNGIVVKILTGIKDAQTRNSILLYPNPNKGGFTLSGQLINQSEEAVQVEVVNTLGQVVYKKELSAQNGSLDVQIQLGAVAPGTYLLRIHNNGLSEAIRFTVQ